MAIASECCKCKTPRPEHVELWGYMCSDCTNVFCEKCADEDGMRTRHVCKECVDRKLEEHVIPLVTVPSMSVRKRKFAFVTVSSLNGYPDTILAIADDGTAWRLMDEGADGKWKRLPDLPDDDSHTLKGT